nr:RNA-directed DNA polymerase, eukaryota, reverse transcriptase zinc-binding domain protein [Tanacetum cinerariifolium]
MGAACEIAIKEMVYDENRIMVLKDKLFSGEGSNADGHRRREVVRLIQEAEKEIKRAVWDCGIDKAPGPDGFTFGFYRRYLDIIGNDVVDAVKWSFLHGEIMKGVIAKVLANRLVTVLNDIVDEIQSAFVTDRQIMDGPFILNEIVHWCKNKKKQSMTFKVDFEKAYDSVRWDFIDDILRRFGFGEKWCKWIQSCLYSSRGSAMCNQRRREFKCGSTVESSIDGRFSRQFMVSKFAVGISYTFKDGYHYV